MDQSQNLSIDYLDLLPDEILLEILIKTDDLETLSGWCRTSKRINNICQDEVLWKRKYQKDFGLSGKTVLAEGETWGELYKQRILFGINSPISAGGRSYGMIDQNGNLYMLGQSTTSGIELQVQLPFNPKEQHLVKFPTKVPPRVINISVSTSRSVAAAVTEDGKVYVWGINHADIFNFQDDIRLIRTPRELILPNNKKAIKIEVSKLGYIILFEDSSVYLRIKKHRINFQGTLDLKAIDVFIGDDIYAIITPDRKLYVGGDIYTCGRNDDNNLKALKFPKPIIQVVIGERFLGGKSVMVISTTGEVYIWNYGHVTSGSIFRATRPKLIRLPEPIVQISTGGKTFAALSKTGKLYMWGSNRRDKISHDNQNFTTIHGRKPYAQYPVEISFGIPINFVSVGSEFTIAVSNDGMVNFWGTEGLTPE